MSDAGGTTEVSVGAGEVSGPGTDVSEGAALVAGADGGVGGAVSIVVGSVASAGTTCASSRPSAERGHPGADQQHRRSCAEPCPSVRAAARRIRPDEREDPSAVVGEHAGEGGVDIDTSVDVDAQRRGRPVCERVVVGAVVGVHEASCGIVRASVARALERDALTVPEAMPSTAAMSSTDRSSR